MAASRLSRRVSEFLGVALFAAALIWLVALATYEPADPVWFFSAGSNTVPVNFVGRVGAFIAELSFQLFGYGSYLIPAGLVIVGWHYFWCRALDAPYTKLDRGRAARRLRQLLPQPGARHGGRVGQGVPGRRIRRRVARRRAGRVPEPRRLGDRDSHGALPRGHPVHAGLARPPVHRGRPGGAIRGGPRDRRRARVAGTAATQPAAARSDRQAHEEGRAGRAGNPGAGGGPEDAPGRSDAGARAGGRRPVQGRR